MVSMVAISASNACPAKDKDEHPPKDGGSHYSMDVFNETHDDHDGDHSDDHDEKHGH